MPEFLDLAVELQLMIISEVPLDDIEKFAMCSKVIRERSRRRLTEQFTRKRRFLKIAVGHMDNLTTWDEGQPIRGEHPLLVLRDLLADPQAPLYARSLIVGCIKDGAANSFNDPRESELDQAEFQEVVAQLNLDARLSNKVLEVHKILDTQSRTASELEQEAGVWTESILSGDMQAAARLLIAILPDIQKLRLTDGFQQWVFHSFMTTVRDLLLAAMSHEHYMSELNSFSRLTEVGTTGFGVYPGNSYLALEDFMSLPSLRTVKGRSIDGSANMPFLSELCASSNLTKLEFRQSVIPTALLERTLPTIAGLQSFIYEFKADTAHLEPWQPRRIVEALKADASKTLSNLELTSLVPTEHAGIGYSEWVTFEDGEPFIGSLDAFEVLKTMRLEIRMLYQEIEEIDCWTQEESTIQPEVEGREAPGKESAEDADMLAKPERLVDILPRSTCRLRPVGSLSKEDATAMLEDLPALKGDLLPTLSSIFFESIERSEIDEEVVRGCEDAGVEMKFKQPST